MTPALGFRPCDQSWWIDPTGETLDESRLRGPFASRFAAESVRVPVLYLMPGQVVAYSCPQTGETKAGTIRDCTHGHAPRYKIDADNGDLLTLSADQIVPAPRRPIVERPHVEMGIKGGQGHTGAELLADADTIGSALLVALGAMAGLGLGAGIAAAATAAGRALA